VLGAEKVGLYSYSYTIATLFVMFAVLGIANHGTRAIAKVKGNLESLNRTFSSIYIFQLLTSGVTIVAYVAYLVIIADDMLAALLAGPYVLATMFDLNWVLNGLEEFKYSTIRSSLVKIISVVLIFITVKEPDDIYIYIVILCGSVLINNLCVVPYLYKNQIRVTKCNIKEVMAHFRPIAILFIPLLGMSVYKYINKIILASYFTLNELGFLESSEKVMLVPISFVVALGNVMLPRMSELYAKGNIENVDKYTENSFYFATAASSAMGFGLIAVIKEFVPLFYGVGFDKCEEIIPILMISAIFLAIANVIRTQYLIPKGKDKEYAISILAGAVINLFIAFLLIPRLASVGAAIAIVSSEFVVCAIQVFLSRKECNMMKYIARSLMFIFPGIIMCITVYNINFSFGLLVNITLKILIGFLIIIILDALIIFLLKRILSTTNLEVQK
jgi:O-antigen/teichoic acid export membrane protein